MMAVSEEAAVSGDIFIESHDEEDAGTLDEPISTTLVRHSYDMCGTNGPLWYMCS